MICLESFEDLLESPDEDHELCSLLPCHHRFCFACVSQLVENFAFQNRKGQFLRLKKSTVVSHGAKKRALICPICRKNVKKVEKACGDQIDVGEIIQKKQDEFSEKIKSSIKTMRQHREL